MFFQRYVFAFTLYLNAHLPCYLFYFKISLYSLQKSIFKVKPNQEPPHPSRRTVSATHLRPANWGCSQSLTGPTQKRLWATAVAGREFLLEGKSLYVRPSSPNGKMFMLSRFGSQPQAESEAQQQIHTRSALVLSFQLPRRAPAHVQIRVLIFSFLQPFQNVLADTGLSLFLRLAAFWTFSLQGVLGELRWHPRFLLWASDTSWWEPPAWDSCPQCTYYT